MHLDNVLVEALAKVEKLLAVGTPKKFGSLYMNIYTYINPYICTHVKKISIRMKKIINLFMEIGSLCIIFYWMSFLPHNIIRLADGVVTLTMLKVRVLRIGHDFEAQPALAFSMFRETQICLLVILVLSMAHGTKC